MEEASPEFLWTQQSRPFRDVLGHEAVFESQVKMMQRLFKNMKKTTKPSLK